MEDACRGVEVPHRVVPLRRARVEPPDRRRARLHPPGLADGLRELGHGGDAARLGAAPEVGEALAGLHEDQGAVLPQGHAGEVPPRQVLRQREGGDGDAAHLPPVGDPAPRPPPAPRPAPPPPPPPPRRAPTPPRPRPRPWRSPTRTRRPRRSWARPR